ncbi:sensor histidine kinase [Mycolicibacterium sp. XJ879]
MALADNASRFTEDGGWIGVGSQLSGGSLRFWVSDSGPGVSDEERHRIFERFARGGTRRSDGAGLGLSIVRAIAVAHGGDVLLDSEPGRGATFSVVIPAVKEDQWRGY